MGSGLDQSDQLEPRFKAPIWQYIRFRHHRCLLTNFEHINHQLLGFCVAMLQSMFELIRGLSTRYSGPDASGRFRKDAMPCDAAVSLRFKEVIGGEGFVVRRWPSLPR